jgi:hypothetical protein
MVLRDWTSISAHRDLHKAAGVGRAPYVAKRRASRAGRERARSAIAGGEQVSIDHVPWQVAVLEDVTYEQYGKEEEFHELCGGVILGESRVLTAAHCMFNRYDGAELTTSELEVVAGSSDLEKQESYEQDVAVASFRVHPYFDYAVSPEMPDDVAILMLSQPLNLTGPAAQAIGIVPASASLLSEGEQVGMSGYGRESPDLGPSGELYSLGMTLGSSEACGGEANALFLCARTPSGSACNGDSGGGLTDTGGVPMLLGTLSTVAAELERECDQGADNTFVNLAAPEIHDFIENEYSLPPRAPRGGKGAELIGARYGVFGPSIGETITCNPGSWSGEPAFTYAFINSATGQILQSGASSTYQVTSSDLGMRIFCQFQATNAGGTAVKQTEALQSVEPTELNWGELAANAVAEARAREEQETAARERQAREEAERQARLVQQKALSTPAASILVTNLTVQRDTALVKLDCTGGTGNQSCAGKLILSVQEPSQAKKRRSHTVTIATAGFTVATGKTTTVRVDLDSIGRALLRDRHGRLGARLTILQSAPATRTQIRGVRLHQ